MTFARQLSDINGEYDLLMKQNFDLNKFFVFNYHSKNYNGILFRANVSQGLASDTLVRTGVGSCSFNYATDFFETTNKLKTTGDVKIGLGFNLNKYVKNLGARIKIRTNYYLDEFDGKVRFVLTKSRYNVKSTLDWSNKKCLTASVLGLLMSRPQEEVGFGTGLSFALEEKQFALYNLLLWYSRNDSKLILRHKTTKNRFQPGRFIARVYNRINERTDIVLSAERDFLEKDQKVKLGARHRFSDTFTSKFKVDSDLNLQSSLEFQVNPNVQLVFMNRANLGGVTDGGKRDIRQNNLPFALKLTFAE